MMRRPADVNAPSRPQRGQALAEFAMALPILMLVIIAVFEAGAFTFTYMTLESATQDGGRLAALPDTPDETTVKDYVVSRAAYAPVTLSSTDVTVTVTGCSGSPCTYATRSSGARVRVVTNYNYQPILALVFGSGTTFALTATTEYYVE